MKKILVCHDGSKASDKALKKAVEIAAKFRASLTVVTVIPDLYLAEIMETDRMRILASLTGEAEASLRKIREKASGVALKTLLRQGSPAEVILEEAKKMKADIVVTGSHGRHGASKFLLGSVSSKIVDHAACSVLVIR